MLVPDAGTRRRARSTLRAAGVDLQKVGFHTVPSNRSWTRDSLPSFVRQGKRAALVDWRFNGWAEDFTREH